jgi:hypothetical protein
MKSLILISLLYISSIHAHDVTVKGSFYTHSCGYFSSKGVKLSIELQDHAVESLAQVKAIVGFKEVNKMTNESPDRWAHKRVVDLRKVGEHQWQASFEQITTTRSSLIMYPQLNFVFEIKKPNGSIYWLKGNNSSWGYYQSEVFAPYFYTCLNAGDDLPLLKTLKVQSIQKQ